MDSHDKLAAAKRDVFGDAPALDAEGEPLEKGVGSAYHAMTPTARSHYHAARAYALTDDFVAQARALLATAQKLAAANKAAVESAATAKVETPATALTDAERVELTRLRLAQDQKPAPVFGETDAERAERVKATAATVGARTIAGQQPAPPPPGA